MTKSRKIDEIYRERLKNVETTPPADSWQNISERLPEKKKRRILPVWYVLAGTAAAIALFFTLFNYTNINDSNTSDPSFAVEEGTVPFDPNPNSTSFKKIMDQSSNILEAAVLETKLEVLKAELKLNEGEESRQFLNSSGSSNKGNIRVAEEQGQNKNTNPVNETQISSAGLPKNQNAKPSAVTEEVKATVIAQTDPKKENAVRIEKPSEEALGGVEKTSEEAQKEINTKSEDAIAETKISEKPLQEKDRKAEIPESSKLSNRFSISPTAAAVYFDNFGSGNILDDQFANRESSGEISMSYGVNLAYQLSERLKIRSGISKVDLAYNTSEVSIFSVLNSQSIDVNTSSSEDISGGNNEASAFGALNQRLGFIEIPLEMEYTVINRKIGLNLIGGISTLLLEENGLSFNSGNLNANVGEANNVKEMSFSANLGVGLDYNLAPRFKISLEPILKYQINTFKNTSDLHPYYFGIYSGLSYRF